MSRVITVHCKMGFLDQAGNIRVIYPQTTGDDINVTPTALAPYSTVQEIVDHLGKSAFVADFEGIDDNSTTSTTKTYSAKKMAKYVGAITTKTLEANTKHVSFTVPDANDDRVYIINFYSSDGSNYVGIDASVGGTVTLTYDQTSYARTISCRIREV